jgi:general stress protein 26
MTAAVALLAKKEGKGALQPIHSTSLRRYLERWLARQPQHTPLLILRDAAAMSAIAAAVDYGITPKRATPGWEEVLSRAPSARPIADSA